MPLKDSSNIKFQIKQIPNSPGVYKYYDKEKNLLYVGKAKDLKKRVSSYFNKVKYDNYRIKLLVSKIHKIEYTAVETETDALLLENSLIKKFQPKYNINLKDDKSYPLIKITNERFPKVLPVRNPKKDGAEYYGPYASGRLMYLVLEFIHQIYQTRNCNLNLTQKNIDEKKFSFCLEYQLGNCNAPCVGKESEEEYLQSIQAIRNILKGNLKPVKEHLEAKMISYAENWKFEQAEKYKNKLELLSKYQSKSTVVSNNIIQADVMTAKISGKLGFTNYMRIGNGIIISSKTFEFRLNLDENEDDLIANTIAEIKNQFGNLAEELILEEPLDLELKNTAIKVPKSGDRYKLLKISSKNLYHYIKERQKMYDKMNPEYRSQRILEEMKKALHLSELPKHIECFDNSNMQGTNPASACVVFKDAKPSKKDYRKFNIQTVEGPNDFASMTEVVFRRYRRLIDENENLPNLIVIDGGKGQLSAAVKALKELGIYGKVSIIGIAKRLEEIYYPDDSVPLHIDKKSETLKIIQQIRDEAHRFSLKHHRNKRSVSLTESLLSGIPGIGPKSIRLLLKEFRSVKKIAMLTDAELSKYLTKKQAKSVFDFFKEQKQE